MSIKKRRVFIVEDHPMFRDHLALLINKEPDMEVCGEADSFETGNELIRKTSPDLAIIDITLKGSSGLELLKSVKLAFPEMPVLILSMHDESFYAQRVLRAGAGGFVNKEASSKDVLAAIRRVLGGEIYLSEKMTSRVLRVAATGGLAGVAETPVERLTDREFEVFERIGEGRTSRQIAEALKLGLATVDTYRARIKEKLKLQNATELQHFATRWVRERD